MGSTIVSYAVRLPYNSVRVAEKDLKRLESGVLNQNQVDVVIYYGFKYLYEKLGYPFVESDPVLNSARAREAIENIKKFIDTRDVDGWRDNYKDENEGEYYQNGPRDTVFIEVDTDPMVPQDLSTLLPKPDNWTPLKHANAPAGQKYLTPEWGKVAPPAPLSNIDQFVTLYNENFNEKSSQFIEEILDVYENMTDYHRIVAEYFQGGKVTPPGIWNIWGIYTGAALKFTEKQFSDFMYQLNRALFTASIVAWSAKFDKKQARPIQLIRLLSERTVTTWDGTRVSNKIWKPFQQSNGRTPPFPDFVSGHSTFSGAAAVVFNHFFGEDLKNIEFTPFSVEHADMISPLLANDYGSTVKQISCKFASSTVDQGKAPSKFPACASTLTFASWDELAELSGISRVYGGIHGMSANGVGIILGRAIAKEFF